MGNYRRPRDVPFPAPGPVPEYIRKATIRRIIQQQQEKTEKEKNTSKNISQNNKVSLQQKKEESENGTVTTKATTSSNINGIDHYAKINGHSNVREINNGENDNQTPIDHENDESEILNSNENILNNKINSGSAQEIISSQNEDSLNKEPINPEPPPEPPDDGNGEPSSNNKKDSGKSILKSQNDDKEEEEEEEEESSDDSLPDEKTIVNKLEELTAKKRQLWQQLRDAKAKQAKKEQVVTNNEINHNLREEATTDYNTGATTDYNTGATTDYNTGMHDQSYRDKHNVQSSYIPSNRDHYDSSYLSSYHHESDISAFHHQIPLGIKRMNEQTSLPIGPMNKRMRYPPNGMHYESMNHGASSIYGPPPTGPSAMTGNGMMGRGREDSYSYYHRNEFRPPPPNAPYLDRPYVRGPINNMQRRLSGNPPPRPSARPPDRPRRY